MNAGPELDKLVAEKVMGLTFKPHKELHNDGQTVSYYPAQWHNSEGCVFTDDKLPAYSKDISAAWEVVEKLPFIEDKTWGPGNEVHPFGLQKTLDGAWEASWSSASWISLHKTIADTAPLAICLAALKAVGVEI